MKFSAEQFAQIVQALEATPRPDNQHEQRRAPRIARDLKLTITPIVDGLPQTSYTAQVENLSSRGLGILDASKLRSGSQFTISLPHENGGVVPILCTVVHCRAAGKSLYRIGAEFTCIVSDRIAPPPNDDQDRIRDSILK
jgi:hypothetical protein